MDSILGEILPSKTSNNSLSSDSLLEKVFKFLLSFVPIQKKLCKQTADYTDLVAFLFFSKSGICFISPNPLVGDSRARFETTKWSHFNEDVATFHKEVFNEMEPPYNNT